MTFEEELGHLAAIAANSEASDADVDTAEGNVRAAHAREVAEAHRKGRAEAFREASEIAAAWVNDVPADWPVDRRDGRHITSLEIADSLEHRAAEEEGK